ncbi:MAG: GNAT family N-acetyltransferase [Planctomycetota bacterium]|nr:GNAT family N-acetyltransferase [Planctomycetota bacterium]
MAEIRITTVSPSSPLLRQIKELGDSQSATLGFLPAGAFDEFAVRKKVIAATNADGALLGYTLYRVAREMAFVVHLCVDPAHRRQGVAKALHDALVEATQDFRGLQLRCRREYEATKVWPGFGYSKIDEIPGRGKDGKPLVVWRIDHGHKDLFTDLDEAPERSHALKVAIDANIFYDLDPQNASPPEESMYLEADWLKDAIEIRVTAEVSVEIDRNDDPAARKRQLNRYRTYPKAQAPRQRLLALAEKLENLFGKPNSEQDRSDLRHLAHAMGAGCSVFVTRDQRLLDKSEKVAESLAIAVLRPAQLIVHVDELLQGDAYAPARFSGTTLHVRRITHEDVNGLLAAFQIDKLGETRKGFRELLTSCMAASPETSTFVVEDEGGEEIKPLALYACKLNQGQLVVPMLRVQDDQLGATMIRHLLFRLLTSAAEQACGKFVVSEPLLPTQAVRALQEDHFLKAGKGWERALIPKILSQAEAAREINAVRSPAVHVPQERGEYRLVGGAAAASTIEHVFWPLKIADGDLPTYIVPIRPEWAKHLFDEGLAMGELFGVDMGLAFNREGVYYKAARPRMEAPGRILWYVSQDPMQIRASSRLVEVRLGGPKELFSLYKRLGVWNWKDVFGCAHKNLDTSIMALRFDDTLLFNSPVALDRIRSILRDAECPSPLMTAHRVPPGVFERIYRLGTNK